MKTRIQAIIAKLDLMLKESEQRMQDTESDIIYQRYDEVREAIEESVLSLYNAIDAFDA